MSNQLRNWRLERGYSQEDAARLFEVSQGTISKWEKDKPPAEWVPRLKRLTGLPYHLIRPDLFPKPNEVTP